MNYFDCHADTLTQIPPAENLMHNTCCLDLARVREFTDHYTQIFAVWKDQQEMIRTKTDTELLPTPLSRHLQPEQGQSMQPADTEDAFWQLYQRALRLLLEQSAYVKWCQNAADMQEAHAEGKAAVFLSVEDISVMGDLVDQIQRLGFRFAMLTWNYENIYGCGAAADQARGLTQEGRDLAQKLVSQQIVLDLSHLSDQGVEDVFQLTDHPVMASHSNVRKICGHPRNLKEEHIKELVRRKGLLGLNFYRDFVGKQPGIPDLLRHMDEVLRLGGEDILAIGSDFDGCGDQMVQGIDGVESIPHLRSVLEQAGLGSSLIDKLFWKNAERFFMENVK